MYRDCPVVCQYLITHFSLSLLKHPMVIMLCAAMVPLAPSPQGAVKDEESTTVLQLLLPNGGASTAASGPGLGGLGTRSQGRGTAACSDKCTPG